MCFQENFGGKFDCHKFIVVNFAKILSVRSKAMSLVPPSQQNSYLRKSSSKTHDNLLS